MRVFLNAISHDQAAKQEGVMARSKCASCRLRAKYDKNPRSILGRLWRWHTRWCPGWKSYITSLPEEERNLLQDRYGLK